MFFSRILYRKDLAGIVKATTFAPALREKHGSINAAYKRDQIAEKLFSEKVW